jgi:hypothetical protein
MNQTHFDPLRQVTMNVVEFNAQSSSVEACSSLLISSQVGIMDNLQPKVDAGGCAK